MKKNVRLASLLCATVMAASSLSLSASASASITTTNGSHKFNGGEWEYTRNVKNYQGTQIGTICYGLRRFCRRTQRKRGNIIWHLQKTPKKSTEMH